jgi:hypothetical protein
MSGSLSLRSHFEAPSAATFEGRRVPFSQRVTVARATPSRRASPCWLRPRCSRSFRRLVGFMYRWYHGQGCSCFAFFELTSTDKGARRKNKEPRTRTKNKGPRTTDKLKRRRT